MKANELRIGNYYLDIDNQLSEMSGYELWQMSSNENLGIMEYQPIPLTEEWLLKFGFDINEDLGDMVYYEIPSKKSGYGVCFDHEELSFYHYTTLGITHLIYDSEHLQYVHQLQNLYYALTNEELTIK